jgi:hypothetical protein
MSEQVKAPTAAEKIAELKRLKATGNAVPINDALPLIEELEKQRDNTFDRLKNAQHDLQQARERSEELEGEIRRLHVACNKALVLYSKHAAGVHQEAAADKGVAAEMNRLTAAIKADDGYAWGWFCNLVMAFVDEGGDRVVAEKGAARFMSWLFEYDITKHSLYTPPAPQGEAAAEVEALRAQLREAWEAARPVPGCQFADKDDGCCTHPQAMTPECHGGVICPVIEERNAAALTQAEQRGREEAIRECIAEVDAEPEFDGEPPDFVKQHLRENPEEAMRRAVRLTKNGIRARLLFKIRALSKLCTPQTTKAKE